MDKRVVVIASGETERRSLPRLVSQLESIGDSVSQILIPPRNRQLNVLMAERLIKRAWYDNPAKPPDKFVVLVDADGKTPESVVGPFIEQLPARLGGDIDAAVLFAYAQQHLEAWFFGDADNLRNWLGGRALGGVDASKPDEIQNPKQHLKNLLGGGVYTAPVAAEIAGTLDAQVIAQRSPSFEGFVEAVINGPHTT